MSEPAQPYSSVNLSVVFDRQKLERFKRCMSKVAKGTDTFTFDGQEYFVPFAHYLVEYLEKALPFEC